MISFQKKVVFIHITKCAGSSIERVLADETSILLSGHLGRVFGRPCKAPWNHMTLTEMIESQIIPIKAIDKFYKFAVIRNPWSRLVSEYFYLKPRLNLSNDVKKELIYLADHNTTGIYGNHCLQQNIYVKNNHVTLDDVFKFEDLHVEWKNISSRLAVNADLPVINRSNNKHYTEYYDDESKQIIASKYEADIKTFNYEYEETS